MKILNLPLKAKWYDMIESGEKKEEYRDIKHYWIKRLAKCKKEKQCPGFLLQKSNCIICLKECTVFHPEAYTHVRFRYGYTNRSMLFEIKNVTIDTGKPGWGAEDGVRYFVIRLGKRIE